MIIKLIRYLEKKVENLKWFLFWNNIYKNVMIIFKIIWFI